MAHEKIANILQIYFIDIDVYWDDASIYLTLRTHPVTFPVLLPICQIVPILACPKMALMTILTP